MVHSSRLSTLEAHRSASLRLCAGITSASPLFRNNVGQGSKVGVVGLGGLGHYAVLFAIALGAEVTVSLSIRAVPLQSRAILTTPPATGLLPLGTKEGRCIEDGSQALCHDHRRLCQGTRHEPGHHHLHRFQRQPSLERAYQLFGPPGQVCLERYARDRLAGFAIPDHGRKRRLHRFFAHWFQGRDHANAADRRRQEHQALDHHPAYEGSRTEHRRRRDWTSSIQDHLDPGYRSVDDR